jgi:hypothetical protein
MAAPSAVRPACWGATARDFFSPLLPQLREEDAYVSSIMVVIVIACCVIPPPCPLASF